jgi:hypothetical protein
MLQEAASKASMLTPWLSIAVMNLHLHAIEGSLTTSNYVSQTQPRR